MQNEYTEIQYQYNLYCTNISNKVVHLEISKDSPINDSQTPRAFSISTKSTQNICFWCFFDLTRKHFTKFNIPTRYWIHQIRFITERHFFHLNIEFCESTRRCQRPIISTSINDPIYRNSRITTLKSVYWFNTFEIEYNIPIHFMFDYEILNNVPSNLY